MEELAARRRELRRMRQEARDQALLPRVGTPRLRVVEDIPMTRRVRVVAGPPRGPPLEGDPPGGGGGAPPPPPASADEWTRVRPGGRGGRRRGRAGGDGGAAARSGSRPRPRPRSGQRAENAGAPPRAAGGGGGRPVGRRPPRTAAVALTGKAEGFSYAEALRTARDRILLPELGIHDSRIRKAANGGILIEIPGPDGGSKADILRVKLQEVLGDKAVVNRPIKKGELRISGMDDSVSEAEVAEVVAELGGCRVDETKIGQLRKMGNGLYTVWVQCPLTAALKISATGKVRIGWTIARVELLKARPMQCFRCWEPGHLQGNCTSARDRSHLCYRCGKPGHTARSCTADLCCAICLENGANACHRVGSGLCKVEARKRPLRPERPSGTAEVGEMPARRAEDAMEHDA